VPLYEYDCRACGKSFEILQKVDAPGPTACQLCAGGPVEKRMSRTGFILKGGGWYVTDFRGGGSNKSKASESDGGGAVTPEAKPLEGTSDGSKPAETKSEGKAAASS
jgi:putative FmdB family regulatory protein